MTATLMNHGFEVYLASLAAGCGVLVAVGVGKLIGRWWR